MKAVFDKMSRARSSLPPHMLSTLKCYARTDRDKSNANETRRWLSGLESPRQPHA